MKIDVWARNGAASLTLEGLTLKNKILSSCRHTLIIKLLGRRDSNIKKIALGDYILNSHDLRDYRTIAITRRKKL